MNRKHYTAVVSFTVSPDKLHSVLASTKECIKMNAEHVTDIDIIAQDDDLPE